MAILKGASGADTVFAVLRRLRARALFVVREFWAVVKFPLAK